MKNKRIWTLLLVLLFGLNQAIAQDANDQGAVDPLDNYIDPVTNMDYKSQLSKLSDKQKVSVIERCSMFTIQNEMGLTGEDSMSPAEIDAYEKKVGEKCQCINDGFTWEGGDTTMTSSCNTAKPMEKDILLYTMDECVKRMALSDANCKSNMSSSCTNDFRYQCYQFITKPQEFSETMNPRLNKCNYDDQTKIISLECRSYCYMRNECEITNAEFKYRKIDNMYLLKKKSFSSCVKGTSYGIQSDNKVWVNNSCHGEFAIQYKDPQCGFRPTCTPQPHATDNIPESGTQTIEVSCNGEEKEDGTRHLCPIFPREEDENGKQLETADDRKVTTYISNIELLEQNGPARCPREHGKPQMFGAQDQGTEGWSLYTEGLCHGKFRVTLNWKRLLCTLAGEKSNSDTCCNGLVWDPSTKVCTAPLGEIAELDSEKEKIKVIGGEKCEYSFAPIQGDNGSMEMNEYMNRYYEEIGTFERLFTIIKGEKDAIIEAEALTAESNTKDAEKLSGKQGDSTYDITQDIHDAFLNFKTKYTMLKDFHKKMSIYNTELLSRYLKYMENGGESKATKEEIEYLTQARGSGRFFLEMGADLTGIEFSDEEMRKYKSDIKPADDFLANHFMSYSGQTATLFFQVASYADTRAYVILLRRLFDELKFQMEEISQKASNHVWNCAHNESCSKMNWLVLDSSGEEVIDFLHDPTMLAQPVFNGKGPMRILPKINQSKKYLYSKNTVGALLKIVDTFKNYQGFYHYNGMPVEVTREDGNGKEYKALEYVNNVNYPETVGNVRTKIRSLFEKYSNELPLRQKSLFSDSPELSSYLEGSKKTYEKQIPKYCAKQGEYDVRVPVGKLVEPLRIVQVLGLVVHHQDTFKKMYENRLNCLIKLPQFASGDHGDEYVAPKSNIDGAGASNDGSFQKLNSSDKSRLTKTMQIRFPDLNSALSTSSETNKEEDGSGSKGLSTTSTASGISVSGDLGALRAKKSQTLEKAIKKRVQFKKDNKLKDYMSSLDSSINKQLEDKNNYTASLSPSGYSGSAGGLGMSSSSSGRSTYGSSATGSGAGSSAIGSGSGYGSYKSGSYGGGSGSGYSSYGSGSGYGSGSYGSRSGSGSYGSSSGRSGSGATGSGSGSDYLPNTGLSDSETSAVLDNVKDRKYDANEADSLFDKVSKRYIRSAYPHLLKKKKMKNKKMEIGN